MRSVNKWLAVVWLGAGLAEAEPLPDARQLYFSAVRGERTLVPAATAAFQEILRHEPTNLTARAYLGSLHLLEGATTWSLPRKSQLVHDGLRALDEAVAGAPEDAEVRFIRAASTYHLPGFFRRRRQCEADFAWLADRVVTDNPLPPELAAATLFHDGQIKRTERDWAGARTRFQEAHTRWPETPAGKDAAKELLKLRETKP
jgi:hypothetical protein